MLLNPATAPEDQRTYVILGTRRGGTSMVAGATRALGLDLGRVGQRTNNEDPRFQNRSVDDMRAAIEGRNEHHQVWGWKFPTAVTYLPAVYGVLRNPYFVVVYRDPVAAALSQATKDKRQRPERIALHESSSYIATNTGFVLATERPCLLVSNEKAIGDPDAMVDELADFLQLPKPDDERRAQIRAYLAPGQYKPFDKFFGQQAQG